MTASFLAGLGGVLAAALIAFLCTRGYYRAAYGDRYQRGYDDGVAAQIRAYQAARAPLSAWRTAAVLTGGLEYQGASEPPWPGDRVTVLGSWHPEASGPPRYADLAPDALGQDPPTSEWARDLIEGIERWNAEYLPDRDLPWAG